MSIANTANATSAGAQKTLTVRTKHVREWMSADPVTVLPTTHVSEAYQLMQERHIRRLPVVEGGNLIGIVTLGDLRSKGADADTDEVKRLRVDSVVHLNPITVTPDTPLRDAAKLMIKHKISGLPVMTAIGLAGIITESDIFRALVADESL